MASSLKNRLDYEYETKNIHVVEETETSFVEVKPEPVKKHEKAKITRKTAALSLDELEATVKKQKNLKKKHFSNLNISLFSLTIFLLVLQAGIYFHSVQTEIYANKMQQDIIKMKESNYKLNVELASVQSLEKVEGIALNKLKMKASNTAEINFLILPESMVKSDDIKVYAEAVKNRPEILTGY